LNTRAKAGLQQSISMLHKALLVKRCCTISPGSTRFQRSFQLGAPAEQELLFQSASSASRPFSKIDDWILKVAGSRRCSKNALVPVLSGPPVLRLILTMQRRLTQILCNIGFGARADFSIFIELQGKNWTSAVKYLCCTKPCPLAGDYGIVLLCGSYKKGLLI
jgi:hypothetical protein